jgi:imidazolonepropionase-like amidohydrolase
MTERLLIRAPRLFDAISDKVQASRYLVVEDGLIAATGAQSELAECADDTFDRTLSLEPDTTVLPGLINMHTHLSFSALPTMFADAVSESDEFKLIRIVANMGAAVCAGVTTVRDCGTWPRLMMPARAAAEQGLVRGPRIIASGAITTTGGHCWYCSTEADSEDEVRKAVRTHIKDGVDFIKLFATGGNVTPGSDALVTQFTQAEMCAATQEARKGGRRTAAHAHGIDGVRNAIAARVTTIEHCSFQTETGIGWDDAMVDEIVDAGIYVCPTVFRGTAKLTADPNYTFNEREQLFLTRRQQRIKLTARLAERDVMLVSGNDAGVPHCRVEDFPGDLVATVQECGLSPLAVIQSATSVAAQALGRTDIGQLARGKAADILTVRGNPLEDIRDLERTEKVIVRGLVV